MRHVFALLLVGLIGAACAGARPSDVAAPRTITAPARPATVPARPATVPARLATVPAAVTDADVVHLLSRATFGPRPGDVDRVRATSAAAWLERQLAPRAIDDSAAAAVLAAMPTLAMSTSELLREFPRPDAAVREKLRNGTMTPADVMAAYPPGKRPRRIVSELQAAKTVRAVLSERQLEEVMVDLWFNHFNVFARKAYTPWYVTSYERDAIRPHALGRFRDLVRATARHPAMLGYLDNWASTRDDIALPFRRTTGLNENYARELLELHTLGVDGGYREHDVREVARAFTGWTIARPRRDGDFVFRALLHDPGEKRVLGRVIPAGGGESDGERVIEILTQHPSTARSVATKLVRRFVADDPPAALVDRVAETYRATDGDIPAMLRTIFAAPEFWAPAARRAKVKKPLEFVASAARAVGARVDPRGGEALAQAIAEIGEPLYDAAPPTGYPDRAEAWVSSGALLARMNFAVALAQDRLAGVRVDLPGVLGRIDTRPADATIDRLVSVLLHGDATRDTRAVLAAQLDDRDIARANRGGTPGRTDVARLTALVVASPDFQRR